MNYDFDLSKTTDGTNKIVCIRLDKSYECLGSSILNGGMSKTDMIVMFQVDMDNIPDEAPEVTLTKLIERNNWSRGSIGFMTAADVHDVLSVKSVEYNGKTATAFVTAGVGNGMKAGDSDVDIDEQVRKHRNGRDYGTINIVCISSVPLDDTARANAMITITEAKSAALRDLGFEYTGTTTDSHSILSPPGKNREKYCGTGTDIGIAISKAVRSAVRDSLIMGNEFPEGMPEANKTEMRNRWSHECR